MLQVNSNFAKFPGGYLFAVLHQRVDVYRAAHPEKTLVSLGVGDVTLPLPQACVEAMARAVAEQGDQETFHGYSASYAGYPFLRDAIAEKDFAARGARVERDEVFISDGAKSDVGNICDLFGPDNVVAICDPTYPAYIDTNVIAGRCGTYLDGKAMWSDVVYLSCTRENNFVPALPEDRADIIYLCFPNNPTGAMISRAELQKWVDWANAHGSVILFDAAYEAYITAPDAPHTIYECEGARRCAIELRSFSKNAGFTGVRLGYMIIPKELERGGVSLNRLWNRWLGAKYNGAPYIEQRGAEAIYTPEGRRQVRANVAYYRENARTIRDALAQMGYEVYGGTDSPYVWMRTPDHMASWDFFDLLLNRANVVGTPGEGFGPSGRGYLRLTGFGTKEQTAQALERIRGMGL